MRHRVAGYKLGRNTPHRRSMWRNMAISLITHEQITTTIPRAKSLQPMIEKLISAARKAHLEEQPEQSLAYRRRVIAKLGDPIMVKGEDDPEVQRNKYGEVVDGPKVIRKLFEELGPRYADRQGGCTRIIRLGKYRLGDGGQLCVLQLVGDEDGPQVTGKFSRRRQKANRRMEYAAALRKGGAGKATQEATDEAEPTSDEADEALAAQAPAEADAGAGAEASAGDAEGKADAPKSDAEETK